MTLSAESLARISQLNRGIGSLGEKPTGAGLSQPPSISPPSISQPSISQPSVSPSNSPSFASPCREAAYAGGSTRDLPAGSEVETGSGAYWRIDLPLEQLWRGGVEQVRRGADFLRLSVQSREDSHPDLVALANAFPDRAIFLDLETCGFAGSVIFLVGVLHYDDGRMTLSQLFARNYAEEKAVLHAMWEIASRSRVLSTFNGKSFDWPCVHDRSTLHHLGADQRDSPLPPHRDFPPLDVSEPLSRQWSRPHLAHCDLLHHSRRKWKQVLPNCRLQTLERYVCGRRRFDDIPGSAIPAAYHQYVRSGDAWEIRSILHHNAMDLITLLQLALRVAE